MNLSKSGSVTIKQKSHRLVTSKSNPALRPTVKPRVGPDAAVNMKGRLKGQPIVAQGHPGQAIKSDGSLKETKEFPQRPIKSRVDQNEALRFQGQPVNIKETGKEAEAIDEKAAGNDVGTKQTGGRQLLNIQSMGEIEFQMEEEDDIPIKPELEIQPENGKLLPWEQGGTFDDIQKVC